MPRGFGRCSVDRDGDGFGGGAEGFVEKEYGLAGLIVLVGVGGEVEVFCAVDVYVHGFSVRCLGEGEDAVGDGADFEFFAVGLVDEEGVVGAHDGVAVDGVAGVEVEALDVVGGPPVEVVEDPEGAGVGVGAVFGSAAEATVGFVHAEGDVLGVEGFDDSVVEALVAGVGFVGEEAGACGGRVLLGVAAVAECVGVGGDV